MDQICFMYERLQGPNEPGESGGEKLCIDRYYFLDSTKYSLKSRSCVTQYTINKISLISDFQIRAISGSSIMKLSSTKRVY